MRDFADLFSSLLEFLVGGVIFGAATIFLFTAFVVVDLPDANDAWLTNSSVLGFVALAAAYSLGVTAESESRVIFEPMLDRVTVRNTTFLPDPAVVEVSETTSWRQRFVRARLGDGFTSEHLSAARNEREARRARVMTLHVQLNEEVQGQLRRLRLERVFALSMLVFDVSLAVRGQVVGLLVAMILTIGMVWLIHERVGRFCNAIVRASGAVDQQKLLQTPEGMRTSAPQMGSSNE